MRMQLRHPHHFNSAARPARRSSVPCGPLRKDVDDTLMESPLAEQIRIVQQRISFMMTVQGVAGPEALVPFAQSVSVDPLK